MPRVLDPLAFRRDVIRRIVLNSGSEANSYPEFKDLLCDARATIGLARERVVVDTPMIARTRPDLQIWLDVPAAVRVESEHLYGVVEIKPHDVVARDARDVIAAEKFGLYRTSSLRYFWLADATVVKRYDVGHSTIGLPPCRQWTWEQLEQQNAFQECFEPLMGTTATLEAQLEAFRREGIVSRRAVDADQRRPFVLAVTSVATILRRAVTRLVEQRLVPDLERGLAAIGAMAADYGAVSYVWANADEPFSFEDVPKAMAEQREYDRRYVHLLEETEPVWYALRAETEVLRSYGARSGLGNVSFITPQGATARAREGNKRAREAFIQDTASLLMSRMLMIRFSEDYNLLDRYISNGGVSAFSSYARHYKLPYQQLVRNAYRHATPLYRHLFSAKALDWVVDRDQSTEFSDALLHAMWILAKWDFATVRGDILSGVYDRYLEADQRKSFGEIYTRPEIARYLVEACRWDRGKTLLDPACGSGTFLVEAFEIARRDGEQSGFGFDFDDAKDVVANLAGLDISEFSATLAKIQLLWHVIGLLGSADEKPKLRDAIGNLHIEGGYSSLDTWGLPMTAGQLGLALTTGKPGIRRRTAGSAFRAISSDDGGYDVVVANPPYVRTHRVEIEKGTRDQYRDVLTEQLDLAGLFVYRTLLWWLKDGGRMGVIIPFSLLNSTSAAALRAFLLQYRIIEIIDFELVADRLFPGTAIVAAAIVIEKRPSSDDDQIVIVTVTRECIDADTHEIQMSRARRDSMSRRDLLLSRYLRGTEESSLADADSDDDGLAANALLTKVASGDVDVLCRLAAAPTLDDIISPTWRKATRPPQRRLEIPDDPDEWIRGRLLLYGVKVGGAAPQRGLPIYKGGAVFPDAVAGEPMGRWDGAPERVAETRFYGWMPVPHPENRFAIRQIAVVPTAAPHPADAYMQNTAHVAQITEDFPLNIYLLSRIPQWFIIKTGRMSVLFDFRSTWFPASIRRIPIPFKRTADVVGEIRRVGAELFQLDREICDALIRLEQMTKVEAGVSRPLRVARPAGLVLPDKESWMTGGSSADLRANVAGDAIVVSRESYLFGPSVSGAPLSILVEAPETRQWIQFMIECRIAKDEPLTYEWFRNIPIPNDTPAQLQLADRLRRDAARTDLIDRLDELDGITARALGVRDDHRDYIIHAMKTDPFLSNVAPAWRHLATQTRGYTAYGERSRYH